MKGRTMSVKGCYWDNKRKKWVVKIMKSGVRYCVGRFKTEQEAIDSYKAAESMLLSEFLNWYSFSPSLRPKITEYIKSKDNESSLIISGFQFIKSAVDLEHREFSVL